MRVFVCLSAQRNSPSPSRSECTHRILHIPSRRVWLLFLSILSWYNDCIDLDVDTKYAYNRIYPMIFLRWLLYKWRIQKGYRNIYVELKLKIMKMKIGIFWFPSNFVYFNLFRTRIYIYMWNPDSIPFSSEEWKMWFLFLMKKIDLNLNWRILQINFIPSSFLSL